MSPIAKECWTKNRRMKQSNDSTCKRAATIEKKRFMPCMPLFMQHRPCMATSKKNSKWLYMSHFPNNYKRKMPKCWFVDNYLVWVVFPWQTKQKIIEQIKARSQAGRHMPLKIKAHISQTKLARPKLARLCMLFSLKKYQKVSSYK